MQSIVKRYPLIAYYVFALLFSAVIIAILFAAGLAETLFFLGTFGPGLAAILVAALIGGSTGVRKLLGSLLIWRVGIQWWLAALLLPALIYIVAVYLFSLFGGPAVDFSRYQPIYTIIPIIIMVTLLNGVGEELGWRGFMLPRSQARYNALVSSLIVGFFWGLWHAPVYFIDGTAQSMLRSQVGFWMGLLLFTLSTVAISVTFTWLFNNTRGSVLIAAFLHGANNAWINYFMADPAMEVLGILIWSTVLWTLLAILLVLILGPAGLSRSSEKQTKLEIAV
jgi:membrane protease YdiL (CAAX protease family)